MRAQEFAQPQAAGCIIVAKDTGRWCLQQRSDTVSDPGLWAAWGGGVEPGETLEQCVRRELAEESGYRGPIKLEPLAKNAKYATYIGIVPHEFEPRPCDEWKDFAWVELGHWPQPLHPKLQEDILKSMEFAKKQKVKEAFDQPYKLRWEKGDYGDVDAVAKMDDGNYLSIMFNKGYNQDKEEAWSVEFWRNNSQEVTGEGDAQRVFATVLGAIQTFIKKYKPNRIIFSASKEVEQGQNAQSRAKLYDSLVQRYARTWGFRAFRADAGNKVIYELNRINKGVTENFADGKVKGKSRPGRVKRAGASCSGSVSDLRARAKRYGGERGKMYHWCANMKSGRKK